MFSQHRGFRIEHGTSGGYDAFHPAFTDEDGNEVVVAHASSVRQLTTRIDDVLRRHPEHRPKT